MTAGLPTVPDEVRFRAEELWAEALMVRNVGVDGLPAVVDYVWAEAFAAGQAAAYEGGGFEYGVRCGDPNHRDHGTIYMTGDPVRLRNYIARTGCPCLELVSRELSAWRLLPVAADGEATP